MARRKKSSIILEKAERRIAGLRSIDASLDLGNGLTMEAYTQLIEDTRSKLSTYNTTLSSVDKIYSDVLDAEQTLSDFTECMLMGVATKYGKNSNEYEMAGGVRKADRKRRSQKPVAGVS